MTSGITGASSSSSITNPNTATGASQEIAGNFQQFLTLLTTQLKNQNPMDPLDTNQFTQQLVQYAGVEQQLKSNDRLDSILNNAKASSAAAATGFIGQSVTADGRVANLKDGSAVWTLTPARGRQTGDDDDQRCQGQRGGDTVEGADRGCADFRLGRSIHLGFHLRKRQLLDQDRCLRRHWCTG